MSRIRSIHPGLWTDERFVTASAMARLLFMGIWNECDDYGSFEWSPLKLKMRILPADPADATELLGELEETGSIVRYEIDGKSYGAVRNFCQYQRPKKPNAVHPQTDTVRTFVNLTARNIRDGSEQVENQSPTDGEKARLMEDGGGNKEGLSNDKPPARRRAKFPPPSGVPDDVWADFLQSPKRSKAGMSATAYAGINASLQTLAEYGYPPGQMIALAVERGWITVKLEWVQNDGRTNTMGRNQPSDGLSSTARAALAVFGDTRHERSIPQ